MAYSNNMEQKDISDEDSDKGLIRLIYMNKLGETFDQGFVQPDDKRFELISAQRYLSFIKTNKITF